MNYCDCKDPDGVGGYGHFQGCASLKQEETVMATRPHEYLSRKIDGLTIDFRVFWKADTDPQLILNEVFESYARLVSQLQEKFNG